LFDFDGEYYIHFNGKVNNFFAARLRRRNKKDASRNLLSPRIFFIL